MVERYKFERSLCRDPDGDYYLLETITDTLTGHVVAQKDVDVLVYKIKGGLHYFVECKQIEDDAESISDVARQR
jgi:hypothetical protein